MFGSWFHWSQCDTCHWFLWKCICKKETPQLRPKLCWWHFPFWISEGRICLLQPGKDLLPLENRRVMSTPGKPGSAAGCQHLIPSMGVGGSGPPDLGTGSTGQGLSIHWDVAAWFWRWGMCGIQYCDSKWSWQIYCQWRLCQCPQSVPCCHLQACRTSPCQGCHLWFCLTVQMTLKEYMG